MLTSRNQSEKFNTFEEKYLILEEVYSPSKVNDDCSFYTAKCLNTNRIVSVKRVKNLHSSVDKFVQLIREISL